jgi:hemin uptake protein HemP
MNTSWQAHLNQTMEPEREPEPQNAESPGETGPKKIAFETLAQGAKEVLIQHRGEIYRLRLTRNGKLILNK